jgi:hypothetical protein
MGLSPRRVLYLLVFYLFKDKFDFEDYTWIQRRMMGCLTNGDAWGRMWKKDRGLPLKYTQQRRIFMWRERDLFIRHKALSCDFVILLIWSRSSPNAWCGGLLTVSHFYAEQLREVRSAFCWGITQRQVVILYRRFGTLSIPSSRVFLDFLALEDRTDAVSRNVCKQLALDAA